MSSRKPLPVKLAPKARQDFIDILRYTGETWGQAQLLAYRYGPSNRAKTVLAGASFGSAALRERFDAPIPTGS